MHAVILAGGKGVRLRPYTSTLPKPLVPIGDQYSILEIVLHQLSQQGFTSVTLAIGHLGHLIRSYVGDGSRWGLTIEYRTEENPLGTMGPLLGLPDLPEDFLVMNGDVLTDLCFGKLLGTHRSAGAKLSVATYRREVKIDFGVLTTESGEIREFAEKPTLDYRVSMGVYALNRSVLERYTPGLPLGFDELVLDQLADGNWPLDFAFDGYWLDIGRPDDYDRANAEFDNLRPVLLRSDRAV